MITICGKFCRGGPGLMAQDVAASDSDGEEAHSDAAAALLEACSLDERSYTSIMRSYRSDDASEPPLPLWPPPLVHFSRARALVSKRDCAVPFLTVCAGGSLPEGVPTDAEDLTAMYLVSGASPSPPNVDVEETQQECASTSEARRVITTAAARGLRFWSAVHVPRIRHPPWWPRACVGASGVGGGRGSVPGYEQMIAGSGLTGIGMHRDRYITDAGETLVGTYIALARGRKHVVMLPPSAARLADDLGGADCDEIGGRSTSQRRAFPMRPSKTALESVVDAGGYWFDLAALPSADDDDGVGDGVAEGEGDDDEHVYLFIPPGWFHWLLADSAWHVAWSGSYFPRAAAVPSPTGTTSTSTGGRRARNPRRS